LSGACTSTLSMRRCSPTYATPKRCTAPSEPVLTNIGIHSPPLSDIPSGAGPSSRPARRRAHVLAQAGRPRIGTSASRCPDHVGAHAAESQPAQADRPRTLRSPSHYGAQ
jgi:hypothetical protein